MLALCRYFLEAAEGTRTLDLLHGKQTHMVGSEALSSCKLNGFHGWATPLDAPRYVPFRRSCVNQSSTRSLTRRMPLGRTRCSHCSNARSTRSGYSMSKRSGRGVVVDGVPRAGLGTTAVVGLDGRHPGADVEPECSGGGPRRPWSSPET
jgi:hypothetical protein